MDKEIKEILDRLKDSVTNPIVDVPVMGGVSEPIDNSQCLEPNECKILYDYITNLQEKNKKLNNIISEIEKYTIEQRDIVKEKMQIIGNEGKRLATRFVIYNEYLNKLKKLKEKE